MARSRSDPPVARAVIPQELEPISQYIRSDPVMVSYQNPWSYHARGSGRTTPGRPHSKSAGRRRLGAIFKGIFKGDWGNLSVNSTRSCKRIHGDYETGKKWYRSTFATKELNEMIVMWQTAWWKRKGVSPNLSTMITRIWRATIKGSSVPIILYDGSAIEEGCFKVCGYTWVHA